MRVFLIAGLVVALGGLRAAADPPPAPQTPVDFAHLPWADGETATYMVSWATLEAAEGIFTARLKGDHWEFHLDLASRGAVDEIYPFTGNFWCMLDENPWRSVEYGEYRFEPKRTIKERTRIDYAAQKGTRENWAKGETKTFPIDQPAIDDVGTMLYHLRAWPWKPGDKRTVYVYESNSEKQGEVTCVGVETRAFGTWPAQPLLKISCVPTVGTHKKGHLTLWMTDDARRLPLHAEIEFKYGTFDVDLVKIGTTPAPLPAGK
jgi:uncharacterized protein DUF3108